ncbi:hypothetical protein AS9A_1741 [Hoyosella subflava DQS3-9A1]|uniref:Uncharacterized protein n=1 Tax=Hoyosella subflava (strain DSM 45089 / JCM 17490 / NBRC 109087 / DQS3-9A1) TaxID=443218 RepID=F6EKQ4_HOYSD|nr:hypothetical protein AS9A_1741 [Hoyosella subflava DQS3-9A1]
MAQPRSRSFRLWPTTPRTGFLKELRHRALADGVLELTRG